MSQTKAQLISDLVQSLNFTGISAAPANGMYLSAANTIKFATNTTPRLTIDSSGNATFTGTVVANAFTGNASSATSATTTVNVNLTDESSDTTCYPIFATADTGTLPPKTGTNLTFNSSTGALAATSFVGDGSALTGISAGAALTGSTNNTICTVTGANAIQGEANLTFDGTTLKVSGNSNFGDSAVSPSPSALTVKLATDKHIGFSPTQSETGNVPSLVAFLDNGSLNSMGFRGTDLRFATASSERMRINSNGDIGLGVTPKAWKTGGDFRALQVGTGLAVIGRGSGDEDRGGISVNYYVNTSDTGKYIANGHANYLYMNDGRYDFRTAASGSADGTISWTTPFCITPEGQVAVGSSGTASTSVNLLVYGDADNSAIATFSGGDWSRGLKISTAANGGLNDQKVIYDAQGNNGAHGFYSNGTEHVKIVESGWFKAKGNKSAFLTGGSYHEILSDNPHNVTLALRHDSSNGYGMNIQLNHTDSTKYAYQLYSISADNVRFAVRGDGDCENANNSYGSVSDVKLKENIIDAKSQWNDIKGLRVRNFNFKDDENKTKMLGLVAQEAELVAPGLIKEIDDIDIDNKELGTKTKVLKYSILYMKAIKALQEAMTRIETVETEVNTLKTKVAALESA